MKNKVFHIKFRSGMLLALLLPMLLVPLMCKKFEPERRLMVHTDSILSIQHNSFTVEGSVIFLGKGDIEQYGFCYSESGDPDIENGIKNELGKKETTGTFQSTFSDLKGNTDYFVRAYAVDQHETVYGKMLSVKTILQVPEIQTTAVSSITSSTAMSGGLIVDDGGADILAKGVCWSVKHEPTVSDSHTTDGTGIGSFVSSMTELDCGITYYVRAYATNGAGTAYGNQVTVTTSQCPALLPTVLTASISNITETSAQGGGSVTDDGGASVTARGVCWSTNPDPSIEDDVTDDGAGTGNFTSFLTGLTPNTTYYVRSYAINSEGIQYGSQESFRTLAITVTDYDGNIYQTATIGSQIWMAENLNVTHYSDGTVIPLVEDNTTWDGLGDNDRAYSWYDNNQALGNTYGALYNWAGAMNGSASSITNPSGIQGVCPSGWHLPSDAEWTELIDYLGGETVAAGKMKENGYDHWFPPNTGATNESGFTALASGYRFYGEFYDMGGYTNFWTATENNSSNAWTRLFYYDSAGLQSSLARKKDGLSVRCVRDE